jgi:hypothetical protein
MMPILRSLAATLPLAALLAASPVHAADVSQSQAQALETDLRSWMVSLVAPAIDVGPRPVRVSADGDHFRIEVPAPEMLAGLGVVEPGLSMSVNAHLLDGGRWALDNLRLPSPLRLYMPKSDGPAAPGTKGEILQELSVEKLDTHGVFDPSFATTSSLDLTQTGYRLASPAQTLTIARQSGHTALQPASDGRVNLIAEGNGTQLSAQVNVPNMPPVSYTAATIRNSGHIKDLAPAALASLIRSVATFAPTVKDSEKNPGPSPEQRKLGRTALAALGGLMAGFDQSVTLEGLKVNAMGQSATLRRASVGVDFGTPDGKYSLGLAVELEGLTSPAVPAGAFRDYMPRKIVLKPRVGGFSTAEANRLLLSAIEADPKDMDAIQGKALEALAANPVEFSIDDLTIDLGLASLAANGTLTVSGPADLSGEAEITVTGLDALIKRSNTAPELKQIAPVLFFLKGIAKQDGDDYVWQINYDKGSVTVNDTDLSQMMGQMK